MKRSMRFLALALALVLSLGLLASCNGGGGGNTQTGDRGEDGDWSDVDFGGKILKISVSANQPNETTMPECSIYTKGPDKTSSDNVQQKVYERNREVAKDLNLTVEYSTTNLPYGEISADVEKLVQSQSAPDIYINDVCAMVAVGYTDGGVAEFEEFITKWAEKHPEPVYPTWEAWIKWQMGYDIKDHIPVDIAEKLGIKPKEAKHEGD